jgi:hypothetical protein
MYFSLKSPMPFLPLWLNKGANQILIFPNVVQIGVKQPPGTFIRPVAAKIKELKWK